MGKATLDNIQIKIVREVMEYAASKGVTSEQWGKILPRIEAEVNRILNNETS